MFCQRCWIHEPTVGQSSEHPTIFTEIALEFAFRGTVDRAAVDAWAAATVDEFGQVNLIFNNAGVALSANVSAMTYESFRWLMDVNFWGVVHGTLAFLPTSGPPATATS